MYESFIHHRNLATVSDWSDLLSLSDDDLMDWFLGLPVKEKTELIKEYESALDAFVTAATPTASGSSKIDRTNEGEVVAEDRFGPFAVIPVTLAQGIIFTVRSVVAYHHRKKENNIEQPMDIPSSIFDYNPWQKKNEYKYDPDSPRGLQ